MMHTMYKLWYILIYSEHWVWKDLLSTRRLCEITRSTVDQPARLGRFLPQWFNLHNLRNVADSEMLEGTQMTENEISVSHTPTGYKEKKLGNRTVSISARDYLYRELVSGTRLSTYVFWLT